MVSFCHGVFVSFDPTVVTVICSSFSASYASFAINPPTDSESKSSHSALSREIHAPLLIITHRCVHLMH